MHGEGHRAGGSCVLRLCRSATAPRAAAIQPSAHVSAGTPHGRRRDGTCQGQGPRGQNELGSFRLCLRLA